MSASFGVTGRRFGRCASLSLPFVSIVCVLGSTLMRSFGVTDRASVDRLTDVVDGRLAVVRKTDSKFVNAEFRATL
jgi:hypothetical protein